LPAGADGIVEVTAGSDPPTDGDAATMPEGDAATDPGGEFCDPPEQPWAISKAASATYLIADGNPAARIVNP
jgi:hypothetical protein